MKSLKYVSYSVTMEEVPDEVSLVINISGCPYRCKGCHSEYLWEYVGRNLRDDIDKIYQQYDGLVTCVCFMGGNQNIDELHEILSLVRNKSVKTCLYTGCDDLNSIKRLLCVLDYVKIGHYSEKRGGLQSKNTNQKMYRVHENKLTNITYRFWH